MATMSTPVNQLPSNISNDTIQQNAGQLEDPTVADVINEMEREVQSPPQQQRPYPPQQNLPPPHPSQMQQPHIQHVFQQQYPIHPQQYPPNYQFPRGFNPNQTNTKNQFAEWINTSHAQRAILAAVIAAMIFYPFDTGSIYEKIPLFTNAHQYDRIIRTFLLAVTLYVLLLKLNI